MSESKRLFEPRFNSDVLLCSAYLAPVEYYQAMANHQNVYIEECDHFEKQTFRNRCRIMTTNQLMDLTVPIIRPKEKCPLRDIQISYQEKWQQLHWRAIESAYNNSPFFEYYREDYEPLFSKKFDFLVDLNWQLMETTLSLLHLYVTPSRTTVYQKIEELENCRDSRNEFLPKKEYDTKIPPYYQVFSDTFGFQPRLSIIDLLFNMGPESVLYLK